jgi:hypothetical protein
MKKLPKKIFFEMLKNIIISCVSCGVGVEMTTPTTLVSSCPRHGGGGGDDVCRALQNKIRY